MLPAYEANTITGNRENIRHYIGEIYFFRAFDYFERLRTVGDFPIITKTYPNESGILTEISKRSPRNEVARFILSDLNTAIEMLKEQSPDGTKNRVTRDCAILLKSRVALYEASWLKNFKGTAFVPGGPGWAGANKEYNAGYTFPSGSIDNEINFFFDETIAASQIIADKHTLTTNTGYFAQNPEDTEILISVCSVAQTWINMTKYYCGSAMTGHKVWLMKYANMLVREIMVWEQPKVW